MMRGRPRINYVSVDDYNSAACFAALFSEPKLAKYTSIATRCSEGLMGNDTFERIRSIVADQFEIDRGKLTLVASFIDDLNAGSLDVIELIIAFEDAFDVMIPDNAAETIVTMQDAVDFIEQQQEMQRPGLPGRP
jgi:acyl carrier protein